MAWRIVKQPNGRYARWSDIVDTLTHMNFEREQAVEEWGEEKVKSADQELDHRGVQQLPLTRWNAAMLDIRELGEAYDDSDGTRHIPSEKAMERERFFLWLDAYPKDAVPEKWADAYLAIVLPATVLPKPQRAEAWLVRKASDSSKTLLLTTSETEARCFLKSHTTDSSLVHLIEVDARLRAGGDPSKTIVEIKKDCSAGHRWTPMMLPFFASVSHPATAPILYFNTYIEGVNRLYALGFEPALGCEDIY